MAPIGTLVLTQETPPAVSNTQNSANAFMVGFADWGPIGASGVNAPFSSLAQAAASFGPPNGGLVQSARTATDATIYDSADAFFREGGSNLYLSRIVGPTPTFGTLGLADATGGNSATLTAAYVGPGSNAINVVVANAGGGATGSVYTVTLQDTAGNVLSTSPSFTSAASVHADLVAWAATTNLVTAVGSAKSLPKTASAAPLSTGSDDHTNAVLANWTSGLNSGFAPTLGPGQVMAPNQNNTSLAGIWSALATHAQNNNRVALLDTTDGNTATATISEVTTAALPSSLESYSGIWAGNLQIPGITSGTTRVIAPSPVVAALCARADLRGNPNLAAAGTGFPLQYVSGVNTIYTNPLTGDIATLNTNGINVFSTQFSSLQNFGFVSAQGVPTTDAIYWQLNHARLRMAITYQSQLTAQPYQFAQLDGQGQMLAAFQGSLQAMLLDFFNAGALFGLSAIDAFTVNTGPTVNTPASLANGNLIAQIAVRMSPFAQLVTITVNAVPITQALVNTSSTTTVV